MNSDSIDVQGIGNQYWDLIEKSFNYHYFNSTLNKVNQAEL